MYLNVDVRQCQTETAKLPEITSSPRSIVLQWVYKKCEFIEKNLISPYNIATWSNTLVMRAREVNNNQR